ncbi:MAG: hypothetical protein K2X73_04815 [Sphingomonas sp.]|uniref:hypothetical protein n=1 Tax=Sphingomonas sp. TaxID=28214 RepID=UPI0025F04372|nr:hypothetical protein [Sphingomonas sp.]MBX9881276.1 hypothetical protein [Sphingomonas sp.]
MTVRAIVRPCAVADVQAANVVAAPNVATAEPKAVAELGGNQEQDVAISIVLPTAQQIDTIVVGFASGATPPLGFWCGINGPYERSLGTVAPLTTAIEGGRQHYILQLPAPFMVRYINLGHAAGLGRSQIGLFAAGLAFRPTWGGEWGGGIGLTDTGTATRRRDGGFGIDPGVSAAQMQWTFGDLSDGERQQLFGMLKQRGATTTPFLVIEGGDNGPSSTEEVHWGLFTRIEPYERQAPGMSRWSLRFEDWE